jgi:hypothetical protein
MVHHEVQIQMLLLLLINHVPSSQLQLEHCFLGNVPGGRGFCMSCKTGPMTCMRFKQEMSGNFLKGQPMQATPSYK